MELEIFGYEEDCNCDHCGRKLRVGVVPKDALLAAAAGRPDRLGSHQVVDAHTCHIRAAPEAAGLPVSIQTIRGAGYRLVDEGGVL